MVRKLWFPCQQYQHYMMHLLPRAAEQFTRVLNTMGIFLSQCWKPTRKLPAGPHTLGRPRKGLSLPLPHFWCSQQFLVSLSL